MSSSSVPPKYVLLFRGKYHNIADLITMDGKPLEKLQHIATLRNMENRLIDLQELVSAFIRYGVVDDALLIYAEKKLDQVYDESYFVQQYDEELEKHKERKILLSSFTDYVSKGEVIRHYAPISKNFVFNFDFEIGRSKIEEIFDNIVIGKRLIFVSMMTNKKLFKFNLTNENKEVISEKLMSFKHGPNTIYMKVYISETMSTRYTKNALADVILDFNINKGIVSFKNFKSVEPEKQLGIAVALIEEYCQPLSIVGYPAFEGEQMSIIVPDAKVQYNIFMSIIFNVGPFIPFVYPLEKQDIFSAKKHLKFYVDFHTHKVAINIHNEILKSNMPGWDGESYSQLQKGAPIVKITATKLRTEDKDLIISFLHKAMEEYYTNFYEIPQPIQGKYSLYIGDGQYEKTAQNLLFYSAYPELTSIGSIVKGDISRLTQGPLAGVKISDIPTDFLFPPDDEKHMFGEHLKQVYLVAVDPRRNVVFKHNTLEAGFWNNIDFPCIPVSEISSQSLSCTQTVTRREMTSQGSVRTPDRKIVEGGKGLVAQRVTSLMGVLNSEYSRVLLTKKNSLLYSCLAAKGLATEGSVELTIKTFMSELHDTLKKGETLSPSICKQECYDMTDETIIEYFEIYMDREDRQIEYEYFKSLLETIFTMNIYVFDRRKKYDMIMPRYSGHYIFPEAPIHNECLVFIKDGDVYETILSKESMIHGNIVNINLFTVMKSLNTMLFVKSSLDMSEWNIVSQFINSSGKTIMVDININGKIFSSVVNESIPLNIKAKETFDIIPCPKDLVMNLEPMLIDSRNNVVKTSIGFILAEKGEYKIEKGVISDLLMKRSTLTYPLTLMAKMAARTILELIGVFCILYGKDDFIERYTVVDDGHIYASYTVSKKIITSIDDLKTLDLPTFVENGLIILESKMAQERLGRLCKIIMKRFKDNEIALQGDIVFDNPYIHPENYQSTNIFFSEQNAYHHVFIEKRSDKGKIYKELPKIPILEIEVFKRKRQKKGRERVERRIQLKDIYNIPVEPIIHDNGKGKLYLIQYVQETGFELQNVNYICEMWDRYGVNSGFFTNNHDTERKKYPVYTLKSSNIIEDLLDKPHVLIFETNRYAALLPL